MRKAIGAASALALVSPALAADLPAQPYSEGPSYQGEAPYAYGTQPPVIEEPPPVVVRPPVIVAPPPVVVEEYPVYPAPRVYAYGGPGWHGGWGHYKHGGW